MASRYPSFSKVVVGSNSLRPKAKSGWHDTDKSQSGWGDWGDDDFEHEARKGSDAGKMSPCQLSGDFVNCLNHGCKLILTAARMPFSVY